MREIVINTGPIIALTAATDQLTWLGKLYDKVWLPSEVASELDAGGPDAPELASVTAAGNVIQFIQSTGPLPPFLINELDLGEAGVIHAAIQGNVDTVAIDEKLGRRVARLHGLKVTGSLGILIRARTLDLVPSLAACIAKMRTKGIWISEELVSQSLRAVGESR
jgi:predicted nucleic acid-binding protein